MSTAAALWTSTFAQKPQTSTPFSLLSTSPLSLSAPSNLRFPPITPRFNAASSISPHLSAQPLHDAVSHAQPEEEEEPSIGDCLVYEEGIFDDPFLQETPNFRNGDAGARRRNAKDTSVILPENLIPEKWLEIQRELNITKKERRKLSRELEYGRTVEKRRQALRPLDSEIYDEFKNEKLRQLKPVVLDNPELKCLDVNDEDDKGSQERNEEGNRGRAAPRNPRLAVYGGGLEDISELFNSGSYDPGASNQSQAGSRKLFSKEEKVLLNRRVPNLAAATSGKWHPLHALAASGEFYLVNSLLKHNVDINALDKNGLTAIHKAILGKKHAIFNFLLRESANPFVRDNDGATLMHYAVFTASTQMIKILLLYNVDINLQDNHGWTPLHLAVQSRRTDIVRLLLIKGADKTLKNQDGLTALDLCLYSGRDTRTYELIKLMKRYAKLQQG